MPGFKQTILAATATALLCAPIAPAMAAGPLLFAPLVLGGHVLGAVARLATLPFVAASAAVPAPVPPAAYAPVAGYYGQPAYDPRAAYYPQPAYYPRPAASYGAWPSYYPAAVSYPYSGARYYGPSRGYYAPASRYSAYHGPQASYRFRGYADRRR